MTSARLFVEVILEENAPYGVLSSLLDNDILHGCGKRVEYFSF